MAAKKNTTVARATGVRQAVADRNASGDPAAYASRFQFSMDGGGTLTPKSNGSVPPSLKRVQFVREGKEVNAFIPALASGYGRRMGGMDPADWDPFQFANWNQSAALMPAGDGKDDMRKAKYWLGRDPLVFKCTKVLTQIANSRVSLACEDDAFLEIVTTWFKRAMPHSFRRSWFREYFSTSMVPTSKTLVPYRPKNFKTNKTPATEGGNVTHPSAKATEALVQRNEECFERLRKALADHSTAQATHKLGLCSDERLAKLKEAVHAAQYEWARNMIPGAYTELDPLEVDVEGPRDMPWLRQPYLRVSGELRDAVLNPNDEQRKVLDKLPIEIVQQIRDGASKVWLSPNVGAIAFGEKQDYEKYPRPIITRCLDALEMKYLLLGMDKATAKSLRDRILQVTIGSDEYPAGDDELQKVAGIFQQPGRNLTIFWNHTLKIQYVEPTNHLLQDESKYKQWNNEIRTAYGVSEVLTGTSDKTGSIGNSVLNLKGIEEEVQEGQETFKEWFLNEVNMLRQALGVKFEVTIEFDRLNLKDEETFFGVLMQLVQNGIIDHQTAIETMNFHFPTIQKRMEKIKTLQKKGKGIFLAQPSANNMGPEGQRQKPPAAGIPTGGRPAKTGKPGANKNKVGKSQPKAKAALTAKLLAGDEGANAYLVLATAEVDPEDRDLIAEKFAIPAEWVLTEAEYKDRTGKGVDWLPPLPTLSAGETMVAMRRAEGSLKEIAGKVEASVEGYKQSNAGKGQRGAYVTKEKRGEFEADATAAVLSAVRPAVPDAEWSARVVASRPAIDEMGLASEGERQAYATHLLAAQYAKKYAKAAASKPPPGARSGGREERMGRVGLEPTTYRL